MRAAYYNRQGPAEEVLILGEVAIPEPAPNEVRVRIHVSGINPSDIKARTAFSAAMAFPQIIPHQDGSGVIEAVGDKVPASRLGERVWVYEAQYGRASGTAAELVVVPSEQAIPLPDNVSYEVGAALGIPALTAHRCLFADGALNGQRVLVHGGAGVVGTAAILLAKWAGAWVATTVMDSKQAIVAKANGADLVIDRSEKNIVETLSKATDRLGINRIVDVNLKANLDINMACLAQGGVISSYATSSATEELSIPLLQAMVHGCVFRFVYIYNVPAEAKRLAIADITACLHTGQYLPQIAINLRLDQIAEAHALLESGKAMGKVLVHTGSSR
ncbi:NADPH:quinone reductase [Advenella incenata]